MATDYLPDDEHVVRHLSPRDIIRDEDTQQITGCFPQAFELKDGEDDLSVNWLEYFDGTEPDQLAATACAISRVRAVRPSHAFAIGNVGEIKAACFDYDLKVRIIHEPDGGNDAHAAVHRYRDDEIELLELLAQEIWSRFVDARSCLLRCGPWRPRPR